MCDMVITWIFLSHVVDGNLLLKDLMGPLKCPLSSIPLTILLMANKDHSFELAKK